MAGIDEICYDRAASGGKWTEKETSLPRDNCTAPSRITLRERTVRIRTASVQQCDEIGQVSIFLDTSDQSHWICSSVSRRLTCVLRIVYDSGLQFHYDRATVSVREFLF